MIAPSQDDVAGADRNRWIPIGLVLAGLLALALVILFFTRRAHSSLDGPAVDVDVVVASYNESLCAFRHLKLRPGVDRVRFWIYHKGVGEPQDLDLEFPYRVVHLPNVGRCDHTYLHHIVHAYDDLAPVTIFLPGSVADGYKWMRAHHVLGHVREHPGRSVFIGGPFRIDELAGFYRNDWRATNRKNQTLNPEAELRLAEPRPYGPWFRRHFPGEPYPPVICYGSLYAVSRADVQQHPRERYERFLAQLATHSNPEAGHYVERSWAAIFGPLTDPAGSMCLHGESGWAACPVAKRWCAFPSARSIRERCPVAYDA